MSERRRDIAARRPRGASAAPRIVAGALYTVACVALAAVAAWPIYASMSFLVLVGVAASVAAAIVALVTWRRGGGWVLTAVVAGAFVVLAVPLAVPSRLASVVDVLRGVGEALAGIIVAWKDLVTVDLPVGSYRNLLVPALVVFLVGTAMTLALAWRGDRRATGAVISGLAMVGFGLFFGRTATSAPLALGPVTLMAPVETAVGLASLLVCVLWLAWRARDERLGALRRASDVSAAPSQPSRSVADRRRATLGVAMLAVAVLATIAVVPWASKDADRQVLRSAAGPDRQIAEAVSPLSQYRSMFSDARSDDVLFRVSGEGSLPERIRVATLDTYDGEIFRASGDEGQGFLRLASRRDAGSGSPVEADIEVGELNGIWMPTAGSLASATFEGDRRAQLADGFYYSADAEAGVQTAGGGLVDGDRYRLDAVEPEAVDLATLTPPGVGDGVAGGDNLRRWVQEHAVGADGGVALQALVQMLRERGYLSHSLAAPGSAAPAWAVELPGYQVQPSASGHSVARIDSMFQRLLDREQDPRAAASGNFVAAIGDDEQFAVAVALIAHELGFPARVVVGTRLVSADPGLPTCVAGECRARDLSAWTEVQGVDGRWATIDVTPQWQQSPSLEVTQQQDPENVTEVRPDTVDEVVPPAPVQEDNALDDARTDDALDLAWLWPVLRATGIGLLVLLVLFGPFLAVVLAKALRRRGRRRDADPRAAIAGGWDEYVDAGVDTGRSLPPAPTRRDVAAAFGTVSATRLADDADRAVFAPDEVSADEVAAFWRIVDDERRALLRQRGFWRRVRAAVSLRSFLRFLSPRRARPGAPHRDERGKRPTAPRGRDTT